MLMEWRCQLHLRDKKFLNEIIIAPVKLMRILQWKFKKEKAIFVVANAEMWTKELSSTEFYGNKNLVK